MPEGLTAGHEMAQVLDGAEIVVLAVPCHALRVISTQADAMLAADAAIVNAAKGIENESLQLNSQVLAGTLSWQHRPRVAHLSGPSFAREVATGVPRHVGIELGKGRPLREVLGEMTMVAGGVRTAKSAYHLARREGVEMPITEQVYAVLYEDKNVREAVEHLAHRAPRPERD